MHVLSRQIRFSIQPFASQAIGYNSYASKPTGDGLSLYFALWVDLASELDPETGFVVNVTDIDQAVRLKPLEMFEQVIKNALTQGRDLCLTDLVNLLKQCWPAIQKAFRKLQLSQLRLELNPFRMIKLNSEDAEMFIFSEKFEFAAMHLLWNDSYDPEKNFEIFGKCANPTGHGHNYVIEVQVQG
jgi:6-pyruvoyltetrahydropterin/6-carboxytetrahydropterin synthase